MIDGGPGNDVLRGGGGPDILNGDQGTDGCQGAKGRTTSCGHEKRPKASAYVEVDATPGGGGGLAIVGRGGPDHFIVAYDAEAEVFGVTAAKGSRSAPAAPGRAAAPTRSPARSAAPPAG